jgi:hypothetical protein
MRRKLHFPVICFVVYWTSIACGLSQAGSEATETQFAAKIFATQTAEAPTLTNTHANTLTLTPIPSDTPKPTNTPTLKPTQTRTSKPTETPYPTATPFPTPTPFIVEGVSMAWYESAQYPFAIPYPAEYIEQPLSPQEKEMYTAYFSSNDDASVFAIVEEDLVALGIGEVTLNQFVDYFTFGLGAEGGISLESRKSSVNTQGLPINICVFTVPGGLFKASRMMYIHENSIGFSATYYLPKERFQELEPVMEFSFANFHVLEHQRE